MDTEKRHSPEVRERAIRTVLERQKEHSSQWAAIGSSAGEVGCTSGTPRRQVRQAESDQGRRAGRTPGRLS